MVKTGTDRRQLGKENRAEGKAFEKKLEDAFDYYKSKGFAQIDKTPEPTKFVKRLKGGQFIAAPDKKAQPDFKGTLNGGRSVMFEAKYTSGDRIEDKRVTETQWRYLTQATGLGARCFILAGFSSGNVYKIPWEKWTAMKEIYGRRYVTEKDLLQYQVKTGWHGLLMILN